MSITTTQKIIKVGTSKGVTLPAKELKALNISTGDEVEIIISKKTNRAADTIVEDKLNSIIKRYKLDLNNLANR